MPFTNNGSLSDLAYVAGLIDGEGYIGLTKHSENRRRNKTFYYTPKLSVSMTRKEGIEFVQSLFGGTIYFQKKLIHKDIYCWSLHSGKTILPVLQQITPFLKVKKEQALNVLAFLEYRDGKRGYRGHSSYSEIEDDFYFTIRELNTGHAFR